MKRGRWAASFAFLLCVSSATSVVAASASESGEGSPSTTEAPPPSAAELAQLESKEREYVEWLSSPEAIDQREASRSAYVDLPANEARELILEAFPAQLEALNADPARVLSDLEIEKPLGTFAALVSDSQGERSILESSIPVESDLRGEGKQPVDLALEQSGEAFVPKNPLTEIKLPDSAEGSIRLQGGVEVELPSNGDRSAQSLGDMNLFYPETEVATDTLISPMAGGVEVFEQLRSPESPEQFRFPLNLSEGAELRPTEAGGAEVLSASGGAIVQVPAPSAVDAQGAAVPVSMSVEGDSLLLEVPHRSHDLAYPILLDPWMIEEGYVSYDQWTSASNAAYTLSNTSSLFAQAQGNSYSYGPKTQGQWEYTAPGQTTFVAAATFFSPTFTLPGNCATEQPTNQPNGFAGLYNPSSNSYVGLGLWYGGSGTAYDYQTGWVGYPGVRKALMGIGNTSTSSVSHKCAITFTVSGVTIQEKDPEAPTIDSVSGVPSGWVKDLTITPQASDPGFGVKEITLHADGADPEPKDAGCSGTYISRCQSTYNNTSFGAGYFNDGERIAEISAADPMGAGNESDKDHVSASYSFTTRIDRGKPEVELEGQLEEAIEEAEEEGEVSKEGVPRLSLPVYNLKIEAEDGENGGGESELDGRNKRSGMKDIAVFVDGEKKKVPWEAQECPESSCAMTETYPVHLSGLDGGPVHVLKVIAEDQVENQREQEIEFEYLPATGMKDEYVMQYFPLPDGEGNEEEEEHPRRPELAVNVVNGNLVYRQKDVDVEGPAVDLEVERFYNSQLPDENNTEWGDGWTLAQTPQLKPEEGQKEEPDTASMVETSGALSRAVILPSEPEEEFFDPNLQAVVTKEPGGGYTVEDQSGESDTSLVFDSTGKVTEERTSGYAKLEYSYEDGDLSEMAVDDPASFGASPPEEPLDGGQEAPAYLSAFGGSGSGPGKLLSPAGITTDAEGNVWVADTAHNRVQEFGPEGEFIRQFGAVGSGDGQFSSPRGVVVDSQGDLWVLDSANKRLQKFNPKGEYLAQFGGKGSGDGQFNAPYGIAIDSNDNLWVADTVNNRIQEFDSEGNYLSQFGAFGSGNGQFYQPKGIAIDPEGNVWVADTGNDRIQEFDPEGEFTRAVGAEGAEEGQFSSPRGIATDAEGNVWVADTGNDRIQEFDSHGEYLAQLGITGNDSGQLAEPQGVALDPEGNLWVADTGNDRVQEFAASEFVLKFGGEGSEAGQLANPSGIATDAEGNVWVADTNHHRVQEFDPEGEFIRQFGGKGSGDGEFSSPQAIATYKQSVIWVADTGNSRVQLFDSEGKYLGQFGSNGSGNGQLSSPRGIATDSEGRVWVADTGNNRIQEFSQAGAYLGKFGSKGSANGQFSEPRGIAIGPAGHVWVADSGNNRVQEFTAEGELIRAFGEKGAENGQFKAPSELSFDSEGNLWVADTGNDRIQEFDAEGEYLAQLGVTGNDSGQFAWPKGIATDAEGGVWVADTANNRIQEFAASEFVLKFGGEGSGAGHLSSPAGIATDAEGDIWVADTAHNRVQEFDPEGEFIRQFGGTGSGECQLFSPYGIAIGPEGDVWVADSGNSRVQKFGPDGTCLSRFGSSGKADGQFGLYSSLKDIAIDSAGHLWTIESGVFLSPARIQEFSPEGTFIRKFGSEGTEEGQFTSPQGIAIDPEGDVWIADTGNHRAQEFSPEGEFLGAFGEEGAEEGQFTSPSDLAFSSDGHLWVADSASDRVQGFTAEGEYLAQFGSPGNDEGQLSQPRGIAIGPEGRIWLADSSNDRAQEWQIPSYAPKHSSLYLSSFGAEGSAAGEFSHPADVAVDSEGDVWVADKFNNRIAEFDHEGEFVATFGKDVNQTAVEAEGSEAERNLCTAASEDACKAGVAGSADGQLERPASLAIDAEGDIWVADKGNSRMQKFSSTGEYLDKFGSEGKGAGQFSEAEDIAIDPHGNLWIADTYNGRLQKFNPAGEFLKVVGSYGSGEGQMGEPTGVDIGPNGNVWVADWQKHRVEEFNEAGEFIRQFGTVGAENGQFTNPDDLTIDNKGQLWVTDEGNDRVQAFTEKGEYVTQFGATGSEDGQFDFLWPFGITTDSKGKLWIADSLNDRVQRWGVYNYVAADESFVADNDPKVEVGTSEGLVNSVEGEAAGELTYAHEGELLSAVDGPAGETAYEYDSEERLTKVTLPNGTWGKVTYSEADGRVTSVTVNPAGEESAKTTYFAYQDTPSRRTTVSPEGEPATVYDIASDGSVLKWWNTEEPPEIEKLSGSLTENLETAEPISPGDYSLLIDAYSAEGIASIEVIANGSIQVDEKTWEQDWETPEREHKKVTDLWVLETGNWAPGILNLEIIVTDANNKKPGIASTKFWVNIPYTPPPDPEADEPPKFNEVLHFREEFGLDLDLKGDELAIGERIFNLIGDWYNPHTPSGEIARATYEQWGVPLRAVDAAELDYRDRYVSADVDMIEEWAEGNYPSTYGGYYVDHRAGGILYVGFTQDQSARLAEIEQQLPVLAADRLAVYPVAPATPRVSLDATSEIITENLESNSELMSLVTELETDEAAAVVRVGATAVSQVENILDGIVGSQAPVEIFYEPNGMFAATGRNRTTGRMRAGDRIITETAACTAAFGAFENRKKKSNGENIQARFVLSAGHCSPLEGKFFRVSSNTNLKNATKSAEIGTVTRNAISPGKISTDGLAIRVEASGVIPHGIYGSHGNLVAYKAATKARNGNEVCYSGARSKRVSCGPVVGRAIALFTEPSVGLIIGEGVYRVKFTHPAKNGDSGSPVWNRHTHTAIGVVTGGKDGQAVTGVAPLLHPKRLSAKSVPGILHAPGMYSLSLATTGN